MSKSYSAESLFFLRERSVTHVRERAYFRAVEVLCLLLGSIPCMLWTLTRHPLMRGRGELSVQICAKKEETREITSAIFAGELIRRLHPLDRSQKQVSFSPPTSPWPHIVSYFSHLLFALAGIPRSFSFLPRSFLFFSLSLSVQTHCRFVSRL